MSDRSKYQIFYATSVVYGESDNWKNCANALNLHRYGFSFKNE